MFTGLGGENAGMNCDLREADILSCVAGFDDGTVQSYYCIEYEHQSVACDRMVDKQ